MTEPAPSSRTSPDDLNSRLVSSWATSAATRRTMIGNKRRDTKPELEIRRRLHALGLRYRVDFRLDASSRTRADMVFTRRRIAVFVDGCFWHGCPLHGATPKSNVDYWGPKLQRNQERALSRVTRPTYAADQLGYVLVDEPCWTLTTICARFRTTTFSVRSGNPSLFQGRDTAIQDRGIASRFRI